MSNTVFIVFKIPFKIDKYIYRDIGSNGKIVGVFSNEQAAMKVSVEEITNDYMLYYKEFQIMT